MTNQRTNTILFFGVFILIVALAATAMTARQPGGAAGLFATNTSTPTITATPTATATITRTPTNTATPTITRTPAITRTPTAAASITHTTAAPTATPSDTPTPTPTFTPWPTPTGLAGEREIRAPILMYHYVDPLPAKANNLREGLTVEPDEFRAQLQYLQDLGYSSIDLYELVYGLAQAAELPPKPLIFTFDDGYYGVYEYAFPIMQEFGYTGTVFVITQFMDEGRPDYLSWAMAEEMAAAGWRIEPHTKTHVELDNKSRDFVIYQILGSMQTIEAHVGYQPRFFAYPGGKFDEQAVEIVRELGFWGAVTTGTAQIYRFDTRLTWGRVRVNGREVLSDLALRLGEPSPTPAE